MERLVVFGCGRNYFQARELLSLHYKIVAIVDNDSSKWGRCNTIPVMGLKVFIENHIEYEKIVMTPSQGKASILRQLLSEGIPEEKILSGYEFMDGGQRWKKKEYAVRDGMVWACFDGIVFRAKNESDFMILEEVFLKGIYELYGGDEKSIVIDMGMNIGISSLYFASYPQVEKIYGFEPFRKTFEQAVRNMKENPAIIQDKIKMFNFGLSNYEGEKKILYDENFPGGISIIGKDAEDGDKIFVKDAASVLREIFSKNQGKKIWAKIDVEGSEYNIFDSMERAGILRLVDVFIIETHDNKESAIKEALRRNRFQYFATYYDMGLGMIYAVKTP